MSNNATIRRDYHGGTVREDPNTLIQVLGAILEAEPRTTAPPKGYGYSSAVGLYRGDEPCAHVLHGHDRQPFVLATGVWSDPTYDALARTYTGVCSLARGDAALDLYDECAFDVAIEGALRVARRLRLCTSVRGDWNDPGSPKGRTLYVGNRTSRSFVRIYEYSKKHGHGPPCRVEVEFKPGKSAQKLEAFALTAPQIFSQSRAAIAIAEFCWIENIEKLPMTPRTASPSELRTLVDRLLVQYGPTIDRVVATLPDGVSGLGDYLAAAKLNLLAHREAIKRNRAAADLASPVALTPLGE